MSVDERSLIRAGLRSLSFVAYTAQGQTSIHTKLTGSFNVYNALAAVGVGL